MNKEYFKIMFAQLKLKLDYDGEREYLIESDEYFKQMDKAIECLRNNDFDVVVFPELSYCDKYDDFFVKNSKDRIVVFGSVYRDNENYTVVYHNEEKFYVKKVFSSGVEPSVRYQQNISVKDFLKTKLKEHTFKLNGKKFVVLNCAEYYKVAYYIARDERLSKDLFGFLVPCDNNNNEVFLNESMAIHNHNEKIYSFVVNSVATYKGESYSYGGSYVFGRISLFEKNCMDYKRNHTSNICNLDDGCYLVEGMYLCKDACNYYRSDSYRHTPKNMKIKKIGEINV